MPENRDHGSQAGWPERWYARVNGDLVGQQSSLGDQEFPEFTTGIRHRLGARERHRRQAIDDAAQFRLNLVEIRWGHDFARRNPRIASRALSRISGPWVNAASW